MNIRLGVCLLATVSAGLVSAVVHQPELRSFRAPVESARACVEGFLWLEAEGFADYGDWRLDTQFTHKMGSAYLIAPGVLKPIGAAKTKVAIPRAGTWRAWVRTKDWLPEFSPGRFAVSVGGRRGPVLGASKREGWTWERAGDFTLAAGETDNGLRLRVHAFPEQSVSALRVTVTSTWGDKSARIQEARLYREDD